MLPAVIGTKRAAEVLLTDRPITAQEAVEWGMANRIVRAGKIVDEARAAAEQIALLTRGSETRAKRLLWGDVEGLAARLERERQEFVQQIASDEALQGMAAFLRPRKRAR